MSVSTLRDEEMFYTTLGWDISHAHRPAPPAGPYITLGSLPIHESLENDPLLDMVLMWQRTSNLDYMAMAEVWRDYFMRYGPEDLSARDREAGCHTFGCGLLAYAIETGDRSALDGAIAMGYASLEKYAAPGAKSWTFGEYGYRAIGRHLRLACELATATNEDVWYDHREDIVTKLLSSPYWDERGIWHFGKWSTDQILGKDAWPQKLYSSLETPILADGLMAYIEVDGVQAAEIRRRLLLTAEWCRDTAMHPTGYTGLIKVADRPEPGQVWDRSFDKPDATELTPLYVSAQVNLLTWAYAQTQDRSYLDKAVDHFLRGATATFNNRATSQKQYGAKQLQRFLNAKHDYRKVYFADPAHGDLFYTWRLPAVYLAATQEPEEMPVPGVPRLKEIRVVV